MLLFCLLIAIKLNAQQLLSPSNAQQSTLPQWAQWMYANANPIQVQEAFEAYYQTHPFVKNQHTQYYKRWQRQLARQPYWQGMTAVEKRHYQQQQTQYIQQYQQLQQQRSPNSIWQGIGPFDFDKKAASTSYSCGAAHVYTVEKAASNSNILYAGTATAGIWKSLDNGKNWSLTTSDLMITTVRALEIAHNNPQVVYASSDLDGKVYKTTDGGNTWNITGDTTFNNLHHNVSDIVMHPTFSNIVFLASGQGLYRSNNSGTTWTQIMTGNIQEIESHPYLNNILYVIKQVGDKTEFHKSTDHGLTFVQKTNGWPNPVVFEEQRRTEIAVSPADSHRIYALATGAVGLTSGLYGMYVSYDAGESWSSICCGAHLPNYLSSSNPNIMHWSDDGTGNGGQYYYDVALAASPTHADSVLAAGVNLWFSTDGANTFSCPAQWNHSNKDNYVHADIHDIRFYDDEIWIACDGGIFYSNDNGLTFERRMEGIQGTDFWGFGAGFQDGEVMLGGTFHNGTLLKDNKVYENDWLSTDGGDNYRGFVHPIHNRIAYSDFGQKQLSGNRLVPNTNTTFTRLPHAGVTVGVSGNLAFHPQIYNTIYSTDFYNLWKTENQGITWQQIYTFGSGLITSLEIAWSNPDVMYLNYHPSNATADRKIYRSNDGGLSWNDITPDTTLVPNDRWVGYDITISATDENTIWATRISKYEGSPILDGYQVYQSTDGGQTWQNITTPDLDGVYSTNIEHQKGSNGGLYLGTRNAIYYKDNSLSNWVLFNNGLPARTHSVQLVPYYKGEKLRNGTSRSVYECDFYGPSSPVAQISVDKQSTGCSRDTFYFSSHSVASHNATYNWQFSGGTPTSSTLENPKVLFANAGNYSVTLTINDNNGSHSQILNNFIQVTDNCNKDTIPGYALQLNSNSDFVQTTALDLLTNTITLSAWIKPSGNQADFAGIITHANDTFPAGLMLGMNNELFFQWAGAQWNWNSGLFVKPDEWSHVALVITPDSGTVYLNGNPSSYMMPMSLLHWMDGVHIGRYADWNARNFIGSIDEVCIWDVALTQDQIRATQHLTKYDAQEPHLIHYYQFNAQNSSIVLDRSQILHGEFVGNAYRTRSTAPVGGGSSQKISIYTGGSYDFSNAAAQLNFSNAGTLPQGELVVNRLNVPPDTIGGDHLATDGYWIINNYGVNTAITSLDSILFSTTSTIPYLPNTYTLYQRSSRADGNTWNTPIDTCNNTVNQHFSFHNLSNLDTLGQLMIASDSANLITSTSAFPNSRPHAINIYPNPIGAQQNLIIQMPVDDSYRLLLFDMTGKKVWETSFSAQQTQLKLPAELSGIYSLSIYSSTLIHNGLIQIIP